MSENKESIYSPARHRLIPLALTGPTIEAGQLIPGIHEMMPEPFDITNHAGNMAIGTVVAAAAVWQYAGRHSIRDTEKVIDQESMDRFRKYRVAVVCGATALANCITETKYGVQHFPVAEWLGGKTPDVLDTLYSTAWAGLLAHVAFWRKR